MKNSLHRTQTVDTNFIDKSNVFIEIISPNWRSPLKISVEDLLSDVKSDNFDIQKHIDKKTIIIDPHTLKIKIDDSLINTSNVHHEFTKKDNIPIHKAPKDASEFTGLHLMSDSNYLYVWTGERWKRLLLSDW
jgi:hypothetical protein